MTQIAIKPIRETLIVALLIALWLMHLLAYVFMVPPWQHYDEPTHFEYALMIRELGRRPTLDEQLPELRRAIAISMIQTGFYKRPDLPQPDLTSPNMSLGVNERSVPPSYYSLVALATLPARALPITEQLYAARLVSVALALCFFGAAYLLLRLITGNDWQLRCWTLAVIALQPALADNMSAVSSDVLANLAGVLLLLAAAWFVQRPSWQRLLLLCAVALLALGVKRTLIPLLLLLPLAVFLALPRAWRQKVLIFGAGLLSAVLLIIYLLPWPLASWTGSAAPGGYLRDAHTVFAGNASFVLAHAPGETPNELYQSLQLIPLRSLAGQQTTLAAWMRADRPGVRASSPAIQVDNTVISRSVMLDTSWQRVSMTVDLPAKIESLRVVLRGPEDNGKVLYDSLALVQGDGSLLPNPDEPDSSYPAGLLHTEPAHNLLRNSGAEQRMLPLPTTLHLLSGRLLDESGFADAVATLSDPTWIAVVYPRQALLLFMSAWGAFGWGEVVAPVGWFTPLGLLALTSIMGAGYFTLLATRAGQIDGEHWQLWAWWLCLGAVAIGWGAALARVHSQPFPGAMFWSFGRYTFVVVVPSLFVFARGLHTMFPKDLRNQGLVGVILFLGIFAMVALFGTLMPYYASLLR